MDIEIITPKFGTKQFDFNTWKIFGWNIYHYVTFTKPYVRYYVSIDIENEDNEIQHLSLGDFLPDYNNDKYYRHGLTQIRNLKTLYNEKSIKKIVEIMKELAEKEGGQKKVLEEKTQPNIWTKLKKLVNLIFS